VGNGAVSAPASRRVFSGPSGKRSLASGHHDDRCIAGRSLRSVAIRRSASRLPGQFAFKAMPSNARREARFPTRGFNRAGRRWLARRERNRPRTWSGFSSTTIPNWAEGPRRPACGRSEPPIQALRRLCSVQISDSKLRTRSSYSVSSLYPRLREEHAAGLR
jgi:hypothetical protein